MAGLKVFDGSSWVNAGGVGAADFSNTATGTYSSGGIDYKYITFTGNGSLSVTQEGLADVLAVGPGATTSGNGNGGVVAYASIILPVGIYSVAIGVSETSQGASNSTPTRFGSLIGAGRGISASNLGNGGFSANANGVVLSVTGTSREYGAAGSRKSSLTNAQDRYGIGGDPAISNRAGNGVLIVRVTV
jgi:hypothetical protein